MKLRNLLIASLLIVLPFCQALAFEVIIRDDAGKGARDVVVAMFPNSTASGAIAKNLHITQKDKLFNPFVSVVQAGSKVSFPNKDKTRHHVYSFSKAKQFQLPLFLGDSKKVQFDVSGIVSLGCNIHDWMLAYLVVVDTPYYAVTNKKGIADLGALPVGSYTLSYWYPGTQGGQKLSMLDNNVLATQQKYQIIVPKGSVKKRPKKPMNADEDY